MRGKIQIVGSIIGIAISAYSIILGLAGSVAMISEWTIPAPYLYGFGLLVFAGFMGWTLSDYRNRINVFENVQPKIVYIESRAALLFVKRQRKRQSIFNVIQVWFMNSPVKPLEQSVARQVTAIIEFWDMDTNATSPLFWSYGQWAISTAPDHVGARGRKSELDIAPNYTRAKLYIALKWQVDDECYGYAIESFRPHPDGRNPKKRLPQGEYRVCVKLSGIGVDQSPFWFRFVNPGRGNGLENEHLKHIRIA